MALDDFLAAGFSTIQALVGLNTEESQTLEFKRKSSPTETELSKEDRKAFGEVISGFANAVGGTLVLGVVTESSHGIDRAKSIIEIENIVQVAERYRAYATECVSPPVEGLEIRAIPSIDGRGVLIVQVPKGQARPHMSTAPGHHTYYRRVMDRFVPMQHYEVEEMMRIKTSPKWTLVHELSRAGSTGNNRYMMLTFGLRNASNVTARFPYVVYFLRSNQPLVAEYGLDGNGNNLWRRLNTGSSHNVIFAAGANEVLHPGHELFVSRLEIAEREAITGRWRWGLDKLPEGQPLGLRFGYGCEDCPEEFIELTYTQDQLRRALEI